MGLPSGSTTRKLSGPAVFSSAAFCGSIPDALSLAGPIELELRAIDWLYSTYLPRSGYVPAEQPLFEAWDGEPFAHGTSHFTLRLQLAVAEAR